MYSSYAGVYQLHIPGMQGHNLHTMLNVMTFSNDISPALYFSTRTLYIPTGLDPVGRPRTNGWSLVGLKLLILSDVAVNYEVTCVDKDDLPMM